MALSIGEHSWEHMHKSGQNISEQSPFLRYINTHLDSFVSRLWVPGLTVRLGCQQGDGPGCCCRWRRGESVCRLCGVRLNLIDLSSRSRCAVRPCFFWNCLFLMPVWGLGGAGLKFQCLRWNTFGHWDGAGWCRWWCELFHCWFFLHVFRFCDLHLSRFVLKLLCFWIMNICFDFWLLFHGTGVLLQICQRSGQF